MEQPFKVNKKQPVILSVFTFLWLDKLQKCQFVPRLVNYYLFEKNLSLNCVNGYDLQISPTESRSSCYRTDGTFFFLQHVSLVALIES